MFGRKKQGKGVTRVAQTVPKNPADNSLFSLSRYAVQTSAERQLYAALRESVPMIDAALGKIIRLIGGFHIRSENAECERMAQKFVREVKSNGTDQGLHGFIYTYLDTLLTFGEAVGEMIPAPDGEGIAALYNAKLDDVEIRADGSPLNLLVCRRDIGGITPVKYQNLVVVSLLNQRAGTARGTSLLRGLPFVSGILLRIFESVKNNWERVGDIRFAVTYKPENGVFSEENAQQIADEWRKAMRSDSVCDFVSVGDVSVKVIGAENNMPECEVPVRALLEQITSKLGIPPFCRGRARSA